MTSNSEKLPPERLELRARPQPIRRLNRRALMAGCAMVALLIAGAAILALSPPRLFKPAERPELYNTDRKQTADGLTTLPKSYQDVPKLGPPSPGDIGRAFAESEKKSPAGSSGTAFQADPELDAERAERIRQARIAQQAKESALLFRLSEKRDRRKDPSRRAPSLGAPLGNGRFSWKAALNRPCSSGSPPPARPCARRRP